MPEKFHYIIPASPPSADIFATYRITHEFHREATYRQELKDYYQWYQEVAQQHQQELQQMQREAKIFRLFLGRRGYSSEQ